MRRLAPFIGKGLSYMTTNRGTAVPTYFYKRKVESDLKLLLLQKKSRKRLKAITFTKEK
ncbi:hypothetical protein LguiA_022975 [Lonicera macranthoides]